MSSNFFNGNLAFTRYHDHSRKYKNRFLVTLKSEILFRMSIIFSYMSDFWNMGLRLSPHPLTDFLVDARS